MTTSAPTCSRLLSADAFSTATSAWQPLREQLQDALEEQTKVRRARKTLNDQRTRLTAQMREAALAENFQLAGELKVQRDALSPKLTALDEPGNACDERVKFVRELANEFCFAPGNVGDSLLKTPAEVVRALFVDPVSGEATSIVYLSDQARVDVTIGDRSMECDVDYLATWAREMNLLFETKKGRVVFD